MLLYLLESTDRCDTKNPNYESLTWIFCDMRHFLSPLFTSISCFQRQLKLMSINLPASRRKWRRGWLRFQVLMLATMKMAASNHDFKHDHSRRWQLLGYSVMWPCSNRPTFQRSVVPPSSGWSQKAVIFWSGDG